MELFNPKNLHYPFVKTFKFFVITSSVLMLLSMILMFAAPGFKYGIDFRGGTEAAIAFKDPTIDTAKLRGELDKKIPGLSIVEVQNKAAGEFPKEFLVTGITDSKENIQKVFDDSLAKFGEKNSAWRISKLDTVGPKVGGELRRAAFWSLLYTALLITLYIYFRFDGRFAPGAMIAVVHDLLLTSGFLVICRIEVSTEIVAALLTLAGYSINDTVVVFDRIREVEHTMIGRSKESMIDYAINSTLSRTLNTGAITLLSLLILFFVGGPTLHDFSLTLFVGIVVGTYSSIFIAAPTYLWGDKLWGQKPLVTSTTPPPKKPQGKMKAAKV